MRFEPKTEKEVSEAGLLPHGTYDFEVVEAVEKQSKAGNDMVELKVRVFDSQGRYRNIFDYLVGSDGSAYKVRHFAEATDMLDAYDHGELRAQDMIGRAGQCKVIIKKDKSGQYPDKNSIADYLKASSPTSGDPRPEPPPIDDDIPF